MSGLQAYNASLVYLGQLVQLFSADATAVESGTARVQTGDTMAQFARVNLPAVAVQLKTLFNGPPPVGSEVLVPTVKPLSAELSTAIVSFLQVALKIDLVAFINYNKVNDMSLTDLRKISVPQLKQIIRTLNDDRFIVLLEQAEVDIRQRRARREDEARERRRQRDAQLPPEQIVNGPGLPLPPAGPLPTNAPSIQGPASDDSGFYRPNSFGFAATSAYIAKITDANGNVDYRQVLWHRTARLYEQDPVGIAFGGPVNERYRYRWDQGNRFRDILSNKKVYIEFIDVGTRAGEVGGVAVFPDMDSPTIRKWQRVLSVDADFNSFTTQEPDGSTATYIWQGNVYNTMWRRTDQPDSPLSIYFGGGGLNILPAERTYLNNLAKAGTVVVRRFGDRKEYTVDIKLKQPTEWMTRIFGEELAVATISTPTTYPTQLVWDIDNLWFMKDYGPNGPRWVLSVPNQPI